MKYNIQKNRPTWCKTALHRTIQYHFCSISLSTSWIILSPTATICYKSGDSCVCCACHINNANCVWLLREMFGGLLFLIWNVKRIRESESNGAYPWNCSKRKSKLAYEEHGNDGHQIKNEMRNSANHSCCIYLNCSTSVCFFLVHSLKVMPFANFSISEHFVSHRLHYIFQI